MKKLLNRISIILAITTMFSIVSCKKSLEVAPPVNSLSTATTFNAKSTIDGVMSDVYILFYKSQNTRFILGTLSNLADDGYNPTAPSDYINAATNNVTPISYQLPDWDNAYAVLYEINTLLEGIPGATAPGFTAADKKVYIAALKTMRAAYYFQLVRSYGEVPLILGTDVKMNAVKGRDAVATVYAAIEKDLQDAVADLPAALGAKYYISNKYIPQAILAEVYLTQKKWAQAEAAASDIINGNAYQLDASVNDVFLQASTESIMAAPPVYSDFNTDISFKVGTTSFNLFFPEGFQQRNLETRGFALSPNLLNSFEPGDQRLANWVILLNSGNYANPGNRMFCYKYKYNNVFYTGTIPPGQEEEDKIIRLAEIYLLRAEARAQQGTNLNGAKTDLNMVRNRAGLGNTTAATQTAIVDAVLNERRHELFFEGYRWFDLVRTGKANATLSAISYKTNWKPYMVLFPLSPAILTANPKLVQTPGY